MVSRNEKLLRVPVVELRIGQHMLDKETTHYLVHVHRAAVGDRFMAFDVEAAAEATATLLTVDSRHAADLIECVRDSCCIPRHRLALVQSFGKGTKIDQAVRDATVLDVSELWVVSSARSALTVPKETGGRLRRWRKIAVEAARQCQRGNIPNIVGVRSFSEALASLADFSGNKWILSPRAANTLGENLSASRASDVTLLVGPEGGFDDQEYAEARQAGFVEVRLGLRVLRSETAVTAALGAIAAFRDR